MSEAATATSNPTSTTTSVASLMAASTGATAVGPGTFLQPATEEPWEGPRTRVAVVGTGGWGAQHTRVFSSRPDCEVVAVAGRSPERTAARAAQVGAEPFTDLQQMLDVARPDLVSVCLPNEEHFAPTTELLAAGVPVLVEKPLVFDLREADQLLAQAEATCPFFAINFNHRYAEPVQRAHAAITAGALGDLTFATWRFGGEANHGSSRHANLIETQCHGFDLLEHLCGPISALSAHMSDATYGDYSTIALALTFASGAVGTLLGSYDSSYAYPDSQLVEVNGTRGRASIHDTVRRLELSRAGDAQRSVWEAGYFDDEARSFHLTFDRHVQDLLSALRAGGPPPVPASAGRRALQLAPAAIASFAGGQRVSVDPPSV